MKLTRAQRKQFAIALQSAYYKWDLLNQLLLLDLGEPLNTITAPNAMPAVILDVVAWAEGNGRIQELIERAHARVPGNSELRAFTLEMGVEHADRVPQSAPLWQVLEKTVLARVSFANPRQFREGMTRAESAVCRIELPKHGWGSGVLVGPDTVLTNYHVIEDLYLGLAKPEQVNLEFDYAYGPNGEAPTGVTACKLVDTNWLIAFSNDTALDYAIVRLDRPVGNQPALHQRAQAMGEPAPKRGWLTPQSYIFNAQEQEPLFILQHPQLREGEPTDPLKVTLGFVTGTPTSNRVHYNTNTMPGSSGSPCFRVNWDLVALHHSATGMPANEGIPLKAILEDLAGQNPPVSFGM
jgi:hypothetical protein